MKVKLNPMFDQASGQLGEMVFRELRGKTFVSRKPSVTAEPTENQVEHRERFKQAAAYGKSALADPLTRELYEEAAKNKNIPVFAATIADFFNAPVIDAVDLSAYNGQEGDIVRISARDDFGVVAVRVSITGNSGETIESGNAVAAAGGWVYTATASVNAGTPVTVHVVATDRPGGTGVSSSNKTL
jgi:hypothetical protein